MKPRKLERRGAAASGFTTSLDEDNTNNGGHFIRIGHEKFDLILNIMIGIKKSISNLVEIPFLELSDKQFKARYKLENQWISN